MIDRPLSKVRCSLRGQIKTKIFKQLMILNLDERLKSKSSVV